LKHTRRNEAGKSSFQKGRLNKSGPYFLTAFIEKNQQKGELAMGIIYNENKYRLYEKRAEAGKRLAYRTQLADLRNRKTGKTLKVVSYPQHEERVPSIRIAGRWLNEFGFELGDEVILVADRGKLVIKKKEEDNGSSLV
jgi:hypothetical protein